MRQSKGPFRHLSVTTREETTDAERVCAFLRAKHPVKTAANVSADTGIAAKTVEKWLERTSSPSWPHGLLLVTAYGPEFLCAVMKHPPGWMTEDGRAERRARVTAQMAALARQLEQDSA